MQVRARRRVLLVVVITAIMLTGCAETAAPEVPVAEGGTADPVLVEGRQVWQAQCARCHGGAGGGGAGPSLRGPWPADRQPDAATMFATIHDGRGAMPRFGTALSDEEIRAVIRYVREVL
jgi:mono/diheme cytochrome c family protein